MNGMQLMVGVKAVSSFSENALRACDHGDE